MKIVSTLGLSEKYRDLLARRCPQYEVLHVEDLRKLDERLLAEIEVLFTYGNNLSEELIGKMDSLRWIHSGQAGVDAMPMELLDKKGMKLTNSRGINSITIAEYVVCMLLNLERNTYQFYESYKKGIWDMETRLDEVAEKTIGILGLGNVGKEIAKRVKAFDMNVLGMDIAKVECPFIDRQYTVQELDELLGICDYVVICLPLTSNTYHMIGEKTIGRMKPHSVLINVGRGAVAETNAVIGALKDGRLRAAILDVLETEPVPAGSELWNIDGLMITPHIAGDRQASYMPRMMDILCYNLDAYPQFSLMKNPVDTSLGF